jgi:hypothetical protein
MLTTEPGHTMTEPAKLHRTPVHVTLLALVRDGRIEWRTQIGANGGFAPVDRSRFSPSAELVAMYELRNSGLIKVDPEEGRVSITTEGRARLAEWTPGQVST